MLTCNLVVKSLDYFKIGKVLISKHRSSIALSLSRGLKTPSQIASETGIRLSHVSKTLSELQDLGIIQCETPMMKKGRIYTLTKEGIIIIRLLEKTKSDMAKLS